MFEKKQSPPRWKDAGYSSENVWYMDKPSCFLKALPDKGLVERGKQAKSGKNPKKDSPLPFSLMLPGKRSMS